MVGNSTHDIRWDDLPIVDGPRLIPVEAGAVDGCGVLNKAMILSLLSIPLVVA